MLDKTEFAVAFNGSFSPIHGTYTARHLLDKAAIRVDFKVFEDFRNQAILGTNFVKKNVASTGYQSCVMHLLNGQSVKFYEEEYDTRSHLILRGVVDTMVPPRSIANILFLVVGVKSITSINCIDDKIVESTAFLFEVESSILHLKKLSNA